MSVTEMSMDKMSMAEMSLSRRPRPKSPWPKCQSTNLNTPYWRLFKNTVPTCFDQPRFVDFIRNIDVGVTPQIVRSIQPVLESIQYAKAWYAVFSF